MGNETLHPITLPDWYYEIKEPPTEKNWQVFLLINDKYFHPIAIAQSIIYAKSFGAQLTLCAPPEYEKENLKKLINYLTNNFNLFVTGLQLDIPMKEWLLQAGNKYEAIFYIASYEDNKTSLGINISKTLYFFRNSRVPLILIPHNANLMPLNKVALSMNFEKEERKNIVGLLFC